MRPFFGQINGTFHNWSGFDLNKHINQHVCPCWYSSQGLNVHRRCWVILHAGHVNPGAGFTRDLHTANSYITCLSLDKEEITMSFQRQYVVSAQTRQAQNIK